MNLKLLLATLGVLLIGAFCLRAFRAEQAEQARLEATIVELRAALSKLDRAPQDSVRILKETTRIVQAPAASASSNATPTSAHDATPAEWEKQTLARYEQKLSADALDPEWSGRQEARVDEVLRAAGESSPFSEVLCRGDMCKLTGHFASLDQYNHVFQELFGSPDAVEHGGVSGFPTYAPDGSMQATLFLARKGTNYAFAD